MCGVDVMNRVKEAAYTCGFWSGIIGGFALGLFVGIVIGRG